MRRLHDNEQQSSTSRKAAGESHRIRRRSTLPEVKSQDYRARFNDLDVRVSSRGLTLLKFPQFLSLESNSDLSVAAIKRHS